MNRIAKGRYTTEIREETSNLAREGGLSPGEATKRLSISKSTLENWVRAAKAGKLGKIGNSQHPLTEIELELARVKLELALTKLERDILKKAAAYFAKESLQGMRQ